MLEKYEIKFKGSVKPKKTSFLSPSPIDMSFSGDIELDENDASKLGTIRKEFQKAMEKNLSNQLAALNIWLKEKDKYISENLSQHKAMQKARIPSTTSEIDKFKKQAQKLNDFANNMGTLDSTFREMVKTWAQGARDQQAIISMTQAIKAARVKTYQNKNWRVKAGLVIKVVLVVAAVALSVAAIVLTAGTMTPVILGLAAAGAALAGVSSLTGMASEISKNANTEKKILASVQGDMKKIADALKPMEAGRNDLKKHVTELENYIKMREDDSAKLKFEVDKKWAEFLSYKKCLAAMPESKDKEAKKKTLKKLEKQVVQVKGKISKMSRDIEPSKNVLKELKAMGVDLEKVSGQSANTVLGNLKERYSSIDGWVQLGNDAGGMLSGTAGVL